MTTTYTSLSYAAFTKRFTLVQNPQDERGGYSGALFGIGGDDIDFVRQQNPANVWTLTYDVDTDSNLVMSGYLTINRSQHLITVEPVPEDEMIGFRPPW